MRPWNPAYRETWDAMTPSERRWSGVIDLVALAIGLFIIHLGA